MSFNDEQYDKIHDESPLMRIVRAKPQQQQILWDKYACAAMNGVIHHYFGSKGEDEIVRLTCAIADAFMAERAKRMGGE